MRGDEGRQGLFRAGTNEVWASVSSAHFTPGQLALHEYYHALVSMGKANVEQTVQEIKEKFSPEEFERIVEQYLEDYRGAYEGDKIEDIYEELLADAYAGMNRFAKDKSAVQYQDVVRDQIQRGTNENERATRDTRGAPVEKYSLTPDKDIEEENIRNGEEALKQMSKMAEYAENPEDIIIENAMYRSDIGQIDFVWGKPGTGPKFKKGYGISHIIAKHGVNTASKVVDVIAKGTEYDTQGGNNLQPGQYRLRLFYDGYTVVLSKDTNTKHWVLTAWDNDKETAVYATVEGNGSIGATAATPMLTRRNGVDTAVSKQSLSNEGEIVKQKLSFDDEDYMLAVEPGDMDAAQQMVDEAAQAAGYTVKAIHGTAKDFVEFGNKGTKTEAKSAALAFWFSDSESTARAYSTPQATDVSEESWDAISREADKRIKEFEKEAFWTDYSGVSGELKFREDVVEQYFAEYLPVEHDEIIKEGYNFGFDGILKWYNKHFEKGRMHPAKLKEKLTQLMDAGIIRSIANEGEYGAKPRVMNVFLRGNLLQSADIRGTDQEKVERPECADGGDGTRGGNQKE